jgi:hypothetical protein
MSFRSLALAFALFTLALAGAPVEAQTGIPRARIYATDATTGEAVPVAATAGVPGARLFGTESGVPVAIGPIEICDQQATISTASATTAAVVSASAGTRVMVCGFAFTIQGNATTANTAKLVRGTGATCGTGTADVTAAFQGAVTAGTPTPISYGGGLGTVARSGTSEAICITTTQASPVTGVLSYTRR